MARGGRWALAALVLSGAVPSLAEDTDTARFRLGPFYLTPKVALARYGGINTTGYGAPNELVADSTTTLMPSLKNVLPIGRHLQLTGAAFAYINPFREARAPLWKGYSGWGGAEVGLGPLTLFGSMGGGRVNQRVSFDSDQGIRLNESSKGGGATFRLGGRVTTSASRTRRTTTYDSSALLEGRDVSALLGRESTTNHYTAACALTALTTVTVSADVIDDRFVGDDRRVRSYRYLGGFAFGTLAAIRGQVQAGYRKLAEQQGVPGYTGPILSIAASVPLLRFGILTGTADRDITFSLAPAGGGRSTFLVSRHGAEMRLELPLSLVLSPYYFKERSQDVGAAATSARQLQRYGSSLFRAFGRPFRLGGTIEAARAERPPSRRVSYFATAEWTP